MSVADSSWIRKTESFGSEEEEKRGRSNSSKKKTSYSSKGLRGPGLHRKSINSMLSESSGHALAATKPLFDSMSSAEKRIEEEDEIERKRQQSYVEHDKNVLPYTDSDFGEMSQVKTTIVRSYAQWSAGLSETEEGIHDAYKRLIADSEHSIYIENQFFVSACGDNDSVISNTVVNR